jgi:hypothetical protein
LCCCVVVSLCCFVVVSAAPMPHRASSFLSLAEMEKTSFVYGTG